ncbi:Cytidine deaminase [Alphaproteobacteria bacterium SO-S41]|nr:Cytidine deaminase [Alphaproteobacteria bacterium SO-S41]
MSNDPIDRLMALADAARDGAYAPYSKFQVGAAAEFEGGHIVTGANVENGAFPSGICAERNAIAAGMAKLGPTARLKRIAVSARDATGVDRDAPPCGACRQVIAEHGYGAHVMFRWEGRAIERPMSELLPFSFVL